MKCPVCKDVTLMISERQGVEIDYCPECRGVWLDRGELDKILDKANSYEEREYSKEKSYNKEYREDYKKDYSKENTYHQKTHKKKKESFMGEIFDIFGD